MSPGASLIIVPPGAHLSSQDMHRAYKTVLRVTRAKEFKVRAWLKYKDHPILRPCDTNWYLLLSLPQHGQSQPSY